MSTDTRTPEQLLDEAEDVRNRLRVVEERRATLLRDAIAASRSGQSPNGTRAKLLEADAELDILRGTLAQIDNELPGAEMRSAAARVAEMSAGAEALQERGREVAAVASKALRDLVREARALDTLANQYREEVVRANGLAESAGVPKPKLAHELVNAAFPETPDRWGLGWYWATKVAPVLPDLEQVVTALDVAEHWNRTHKGEA